VAAGQLFRRTLEQLAHVEDLGRLAHAGFDFFFRVAAELEAERHFS